MSKKKGLLILISIPVIIIAAIVIIFFSQPYRLYFGDRITGDISVYIDGNVSCSFCQNKSEAVSFSAQENGSLVFSTKGGEYGDYKFSLLKSSPSEDTDKIISNFSFDYQSLNDWRISKIHYVLNLTSQDNGYKADIKINYSYTKDNTKEEGKIDSETEADEINTVTGEAHCTTFGG
jgi:hypothetical protein